ncbi:hypothetical protein BGY98DRAFT_1036638, partial [Russula aff. rugulosa BPL654]
GWSKRRRVASEFGVWSCYLPFHYIPLPPSSSGSSYILRSPSVITPSHQTLQPIQL